MIDPNTVSLVAGITSIILALLAIVLMIWFFFLSKNSESRVSNSLTKIETQTESLQKLSSGWISRLTKYVTTDKPSPLEPAITNLFSQLPQAIIQIISHTNLQSKQDGITLATEQYLIVVISLFYYSAQTNFWSQRFLPDINDFDINNASHTFLQKIIDTSYADFNLSKEILSKADQDELKKNRIYYIYLETRDGLAPSVHSVAELFALKQQKDKD